MDCRPGIGPRPGPSERSRAWSPIGRRINQMRNIAPQDNSELEAIEQREWRESLDYVIQQGDRDRVQRLLSALRDHARAAGVSLPFTAVTPYVNTIRTEDQTPLPGSQEIERRIKSLVRWNAMAMVVRGNRAVGRHRRPHLDVRLGGHALRSRLQSFLPRQGQGRRRRHHLFPGPRVAPASTRARFSKDACRSRSCITSGASSRPAAASPRIRTRG